MSSRQFALKRCDFRLKSLRFLRVDEFGNGLPAERVLREGAWKSRVPVGEDSVRVFETGDQDRVYTRPSVV